MSAGYVRPAPAAPEPLERIWFIEEAVGKALGLGSELGRALLEEELPLDRFDAPLICRVGMRWVAINRHAPGWFIDWTEGRLRRNGYIWGPLVRNPSESRGNRNRLGLRVEWKIWVKDMDQETVFTEGQFVATLRQDARFIGTHCGTSVFAVHFQPLTGPEPVPPIPRG